MLLKIDKFSPYFHAKLGCDFLSLFTTHTTDPICIFLHLMYSSVPLLRKRSFFLMLCLHFPCISFEGISGKYGKR